MNIDISQVMYIMDVSDELMDKILTTCNYWASSDSSVCLAKEQAMENPELALLLNNESFDGDIILCRKTWWNI